MPNQMKISGADLSETQIHHFDDIVVEGNLSGNNITIFASGKVIVEGDLTVANTTITGEKGIEIKGDAKGKALLVSSQGKVIIGGKKDDGITVTDAQTEKNNSTGVKVTRGPGGESTVQIVGSGHDVRVVGKETWVDGKLEGGGATGQAGGVENVSAQTPVPPNNVIVRGKGFTPSSPPRPSSPPSAAPSATHSASRNFDTGITAPSPQIAEKIVQELSGLLKTTLHSEYPVFTVRGNKIQISALMSALTSGAYEIVRELIDKDPRVDEICQRHGVQRTPGDAISLKR